MAEIGDLRGKRVLLICPRFFGYDDAIAGELARRGAVVERMEDRPFRSPAMKALAKLAPRLVRALAARRYRRELGSLDGLDLVLVVNGQTLSIGVLRALRLRNSRARFLLYLWDSLRNRSSVVDAIGLYDKVLTFDPQDAERFGLVYRPLFFSDEFSQRQREPTEFDLSFIGTAHTDRWSLIAEIDAHLPSYIRRFWYLYLQAPWVFYFRKFLSPSFRRARITDFRFDALDRPEVGRIFRRSRCILDIEHPAQRGLTMRTIEALGAGKKLITTNPAVAKHDFYDPQNIVVLERGRPLSVPDGFFTVAYADVTEQVYNRYSLCGWMNDVLS